MTDEQFKELRSIQFTQLALLQSIEANIRLMAQQQKVAGGAVGLNFRQTRQLLDGVLNYKRSDDGRS